MADRPRYPGIRITTNGHQLVGYYAEARITEGGVLYSKHDVERTGRVLASGVR